MAQDNYNPNNAAAAGNGRPANPAPQQGSRRVQVQSAYDALQEESATWYDTHPDPDALRAQREAQEAAQRSGVMPRVAPQRGATQAAAARPAAAAQAGAAQAAAPQVEDASKYSRNAAQYRRGSASYTSNERVQQAARRRNAPDVNVANYRAEAYTKGGAKYAPMHIEPAPDRKRRNRGKRARSILVALLILAVIGVGGYFGVQFFLINGPVTATVNGEEMTLQPDQRSANGILDAEIVTVTPGNHLAVDESVITEGGGNRAIVTINDEQKSLDDRINADDVVVITDGDDTMEEYTDSNEEIIPAEFKMSGSGPIHAFISEGQDGKKVTRTGNESNKTIDVVTQEVVNHEFMMYNPMTHGDKVIALTFDDGPWPTTTAQILDILKENDAKATFFTIGNQIADHPTEVKRMVDEGHQICTHTWDHAAGSGRGVDLSRMSADEQREEVQKGYQAIKDATGQEASTVIRAPGGNYTEEVAKNLQDLVTAEINWNVDTEDWRRPGASVIESRITGAYNGNIILMHDGGGDRSQTVEALRAALPQLKAQGYEFVTIDELMERYPYNADDYKSES